jgi:hypothetical protein
MSKKPGRKKQSSRNRKKQLSSDARIIYALNKEQPLSKAQLLEKAQVLPKTFDWIKPFLLEKQSIKRVDGMYALKEYDPSEKIIEDVFISDMRARRQTNSESLVNEVGKPWHEIESLAYKIAKKLNLSHDNNPDGSVTFVKIYQPPKDEST